VLFVDEDPVTAYDKESSRSQAFVEHGEEVPFEVPVLLFGIDLSGIAKRFVEESERFFRGEIEELSDLYADEMNEEQKRRP
jgi:hypothetical protein